MEDAPSAPTSLSFVDVPPSSMHGPRVNLSWSKPAKPNGVIGRYNLFYSHDGGTPKESSGSGKDALSQTVDVLGGVTYQFHVRAVTIKPGPNETITVTTKEYAPSVGPEPVLPSSVNKTTFNISWERLPREKSYGKVTLYEVKASFVQKEDSCKRSVINGFSANTSATFVVLSDFELCSKYNVSVRAYTTAGSGPYGKPLELRTSRFSHAGGGTKENSSGSNAAAVAAPVVLLLLLIPAVVVAVFFYRRRRQSISKVGTERSARFDDLKDDDENPRACTSDRVYQNVGVTSQSIKGEEQWHVCEEEEAIYSEADDGKPKPIPVADFAKYWKKKSENGAIVLREEYKNLPGGLQFAWNIGKRNRSKNRYGNIVSYDHSRVELEEIEGDKNSSYINASYIPSYDEVTITYIATQGPTSTTMADFWRMVWHESCSSIVMLTNLVEQGKSKCDQYWPDDTFKYGAIRVTLQKTETFADYVIRSFIVTKDSEKRNVLQFHFETWPDKGVPHHSTALLGFRQKIHARHQATGGPLLVHCSAGVGRTGTYIAIDAMLEGAEKIKTVFIQNYVQVMRRSRPHMVQKDDQYVFMHQAVMEALVGGNTEIESQDLRVKLRKLAMVHKSSKKTGYEREFKRLELVTDIQASQEEAKEAFMPANVAKNRFPNIVPLDNARAFLQASSQEESYINASFVDDYRQRSAYILTQAPLDNTVVDFWKMISQYNIGTVVMLNSLKEGEQSYPQYWPSERSAKYGEITVRLLSQETSSNITTRKFSVKNAALSLKTSTLQHLQYTGWADRNSCPDPQEILDLMTAVQQSQQQSGNGVVVFQCSDGTGRSGCVAAIMSVIERVKIEQTVDVFQTVKLLRAKRSGAVNTVEQYMFCYKTVLAYLDSFSAYSNFAEC